MHRWGEPKNAQIQQSKNYFCFFNKFQFSMEFITFKLLIVWVAIIRIPTENLTVPGSGNVECLQAQGVIATAPTWVWLYLNKVWKWPMYSHEQLVGMKKQDTRRNETVKCRDLWTYMGMCFVMMQSKDTWINW